jgi:putative nucleotidyltransferase with HDIG domain
MSEVLELLNKALRNATSAVPTLPQGVAEALRLARDPKLEFRDVTSLAESDPPLSGRLLAVANSALYARGQPVGSIRTAVVRLGMQTLRDILYQTAYASMLVDSPRHRERVYESFRHGVLAARICRLLAFPMHVEADLAYLAGLMHDVGRARCWKVLDRVPLEDRDEEACAAVDAAHAKAGADVATAWRLPAEVVEACEFHHEPEGKPWASLVAAADALARRAEGRGSDVDVIIAFERLGLGEGLAADLAPRVQEAAEAVESEVQRVSALPRGASSKPSRMAG